MPSGSKRIASEEIIELNEPAYINPPKKSMLTAAVTTEVKKVQNLPVKKSYLSNMIKKKEIPTPTAIVPKTSIGGLALLGDYSDSD